MEFNQIKETCLYVKNLDKTISFYRDMVGLNMFAFVENRFAFFRAGSSVLLCFNPEDTKNQNTLPPHFGTGQLHLAFECEISDYEKWKSKIQNSEIQIEYEHEWEGGFLSFYFRDPDNHCIEVIQKGMWEH